MGPEPSFLDRLGPGCPKCGEFVPFGKTQWGLGKTFFCKYCGAGLIIPKVKFLTILPFFALSYSGKDRFPAGALAWVCLILLIMLPVMWLITKPKPAGSGEEQDTP
jgi:hypothetical protein